MGTKNRKPDGYLLALARIYTIRNGVRRSVRHESDGHLAVAFVRPGGVVLIGAGVVGTTSAAALQTGPGASLPATVTTTAT